MSGPFGSSQWMYASGGFYGFEISNSLRFNDGDSAYLTRTPSSASNQKTWTWSGWVKRGIITTDQVYFGARALSTSTPYFFFGFNTSTDILAQNSNNAGALYTTQKFRDTSAWYHIVYAVDTTQGTASNRVKVYVNGSQITDFGTENDPSLNVDTAINSTIAHWTGIITNGAGSRTNPIDGYMADVNFIDGTALTPASFGELKNDIWIPKNTSGLTFGTNGYRLEFKQTGTGTASSSTIGADTSGNDNHWTSNNLVASDVVPDSPTNNFATWNPIALDTLNIAFSEGNLQAVKASDSASPTTRSTFGMTQGSWYWETRLEAFAASGGTVYGVGIDTDETDQGDSDNSYNTVRFVVGAAVGPVYQKTTNGSFGGNVSYGTNASNGDIIGVKLDIDNEVVAFSRNGTFFADISLPALGKTYFASNITDQGSNTYTAQINFGQDSTFAGNETAQGNADENGIGDFYYAPPSGSLALCTANLPAPVAAVDPAQGGSPQDYFSADIFTGNGTNQDIDIGFVPNLVWTRQRTDASGGLWMDSVRGDDAYFQTTNANAEGNFGNITFTSTGYNVSGNSNLDNEASHNFVGWAWKAGTAFSNDASATGVGNVDSTGSVNADVGFSIIAKTNTGNDNQTVAHGLGVAPDLIIIKNRSATGSFVIGYNTAGFNWANDYIQFDTGGEKGDGSGTVFGAAPTSTVFTTGSGVNVTNGVTQIAYCFASVDGYSKIGSYTGNGNADGPFIYTGFRPAWIMIKRIDANGNSWRIHDSKRGSNGAINTLHANLTNAEDANNVDDDILSNGYKVRTTSSDQNTDGATYIYMAFAEQPFKYANAR